MVRQISAYGVGKALTEQNGELAGGLFRGDRRHLPAFLNLAQGKVEQLAGSFVVRDMAPVLTILRSCMCMLSIVLVV
ncbi:hypothetical protein [Chromobacterium piscinae]|uniref:hypothetical protein n=1 Tax=Chromobacterium piscinae TaxID=686831 RepID=UPI003524AB04